MILIEAGQPEEAVAIAARIDGRRAQLEPWGNAAVGLIGGLVALARGETDRSLELLRSAADRFAALETPWFVGLTQLGLGRALRRAGRRRAAAGALDQAAEIFRVLGAVPAQRVVADELRRARPRPRHDDELTAAESRVAALVADGRTNREVAAALFTTVATVEAHLTRIYGKLGIRSRVELVPLVTSGALRIEDQSEMPWRETPAGTLPATPPTMTDSTIRSKGVAARRNRSRTASEDEERKR